MIIWKLSHVSNVLHREMRKKFLKPFHVTHSCDQWFLIFSLQGCISSEILPCMEFCKIYIICIDFQYNTAIPHSLTLSLNSKSFVTNSNERHIWVGIIFIMRFNDIFRTQIKKPHCILLLNMVIWTPYGFYCSTMLIQI